MFTPFLTALLQLHRGWVVVFVVVVCFLLLLLFVCLFVVVVFVHLQAREQ